MNRSFLLVFLCFAIAIPLAGAGAYAGAPINNSYYDFQVNISAINTFDAELYGHTQHYWIAAATATNLPADCKGMLYKGAAQLPYKINATNATGCLLTINDTIRANATANYTFAYGGTGSTNDITNMGYRPAYDEITEDFDGATWNANYAWGCTYNGAGCSYTSVSGGMLSTARPIVLNKSSSQANGTTGNMPTFYQDGNSWNLHTCFYMASGTYGRIGFGNASNLYGATSLEYPYDARFDTADGNQIMVTSFAGASVGTGIAGDATPCTPLHMIINNSLVGKAAVWVNNATNTYFEAVIEGSHKTITSLIIVGNKDDNSVATYDYAYLGKEVYLATTTGEEEGTPNYIQNTLKLHTATYNSNSLYVNTQFSTNITAVNATTNATVDYVDIEFNGANHTAALLQALAGTTGGVYGYTVTPTIAGTYAVKQFAHESIGGLNYTNASAYFNINVLAGLSPSLYFANGTAITDWGLEIVNATDRYSNDTLANGDFVSWDTVPTGSTNLTFYKAGFVNVTHGASINSSALTIIDEYAWSVDAFYAVDEGSNPITSFSVNFTNGTDTYSASTSTGELLVAHNLMLWGASVNGTVTAAGYGSVAHSFGTVTSSTMLNYTFSMEAAGITVRAFNEKTLADISFNITMANSTTSMTWYNQTVFSMNYTDLPVGTNVKITVSSLNDTNYYARDYYATISPLSKVSLNAYLLPVVEGMVVRFHILTAAGGSVNGAQVTAYKFMNISWNVVGQSFSDSAGVAPLYLDPTNSYLFTVDYNSVTVQSFTVTPVQQDYYVYITTTSAVNFVTQFNGISMRLQPASRLINGTGVAHINVTLSNSINNFQQYGWIITYMKNNTVLLNQVCDAVHPTCFNVHGGVLTWSQDMNGLGGALNVTYYYTVVGYNLTYFVPNNYISYRYEHIYPIWTVNVHTNNTIQGFFDSIRLYKSSGGTSGTPIDALGMGIVMLMISAAGASAVSSRFGMGGGGMFVLGIMGFFTYVMIDIYPAGTFTWAGLYVVTILATVAAMWFRMRG